MWGILSVKTYQSEMTTLLSENVLNRIHIDIEQTKGPFCYAH